MKTALVLMLWIFLAVPAYADDASWEEVLSAGEKCSGLSRDLLLSVIWVESRGNPYAVNINGVGGYQPASAKNALKIIYKYNNANVDIGLMQINWKTWGRFYGISPADMLNPILNACIGSKILRDYIDDHKGSWRGVGRYNAVTYSKQVNYALKVQQAHNAIQKIIQNASKDQNMIE